MHHGDTTKKTELILSVFAFLQMPSLYKHLFESSKLKQLQKKKKSLMLEIDSIL